MKGIKISGKNYINEDIIASSAAKLKHSETIRNSIEVSPWPIIGFDITFTVTIWNKAAEDVSGWKASEVIGKKQLIVSAAEEKALLNEFQRGILQKSYINFETIGLTKYGKEVHLAIFPTPMRDGSGNITEIIALLEDITKRKKSELKLKRSEIYYRSLIENVSDIIVVLDATGKITYVSPSVERYLGYIPEELLGRNTFEYFHPADVDRALNDFLLIHKVPSVGIGTEYRFMHKSGTWHYLRALGTNLLDNPAVFGIVVNCYDITEQKRIEEQLEHSRQKAERAVRMATIGAMAACVAHEINQPLNSLKVMTDSILFWHKRGKEISQEELIEKLFKMSNQIDKISNIVRHIRSIIKKDGETELVPCDLNQAVLSAINSITSLINGSGIEVKLDLAENLPRILARRNVIEEVILNLLINSIQALNLSAKEFKEIVCTTNFEDCIVLKIKDNGIGISGEVKDQLFEPFFTTKPDEGMGLGLFIVHSIITDLNGHITVDGNEKEGTIFSIFLPREI
ncbi:PAS domain S-box protein [Phosphitispora sp. TUW77]|uniref:PAS domain S-box protein n=1 Tax=Phosphitispora sp. TUW77 TaxID=3152361 RepID=UPI003AB133EA